MKIHRELTIVMPHFQNRGMLAEHQKVWASFPAIHRAHLHVIVVDDCSPDGLAPTVGDVTCDTLASLQIHRLLEKKRWNWPACRNLGAKLAATDWILFTDMDHVVPLETVKVILGLKLNPENAYKFKRVTATKTWPYELRECDPYKSHNDTWLITRELFFSDAVGGYDERLSGCYGTSGEFSDRVVAATKAVVTLPEPVIRYPREIIADASTHPSVYTRKGDPENDDDLKARKAERGQIKNWKPLHGLIPSVEVFSTLRQEALA